MVIFDGNIHLSCNHFICFYSQVFSLWLNRVFINECSRELIRYSPIDISIDLVFFVVCKHTISKLRLFHHSMWHIVLLLHFDFCITVVDSLNLLLLSDCCFVSWMICIKSMLANNNFEWYFHKHFLTCITWVTMDIEHATIYVFYLFNTQQVSFSTMCKRWKFDFSDWYTCLAELLLFFCLSNRSDVTFLLNQISIRSLIEFDISNLNDNKNREIEVKLEVSNIRWW